MSDSPKAKSGLEDNLPNFPPTKVLLRMVLGTEYHFVFLSFMVMINLKQAMRINTIFEMLHIYVRQSINIPVSKGMYIEIPQTQSCALLCHCKTVVIIEILYSKYTHLLEVNSVYKRYVGSYV